MILHKDAQHFMEIIMDTKDYFTIKDPGIVEKDYYVTLFLKRLAQKQIDLVFKGGTCLSKAFKIINRFSEDIDLTLFEEVKRIGDGRRKRFKQAIVSVAEELKFPIINIHKTQSDRDFNEYQIDYGTTYPDTTVNPLLLVETVVFVKSFPTEHRPIASMIYDYLYEANLTEEIAKFELEPFTLCVQSLERTFIDKVFAVVDYFMSGKLAKYSRHIYDLYKIYPAIEFNDEFISLIKRVHLERKIGSKGLSTQEGVSIQNELNKVISTEAYRDGYTLLTQPFLFEDVSYDTASSVLTKIVEGGCFADTTFLHLSSKKSATIII